MSTSEPLPRTPRAGPGVPRRRVGSRQLPCPPPPTHLRRPVRLAQHHLAACPGRLLNLRTPYPPRYPYDWRTKKPTIFRATDQWFASVEGFRWGGGEVGRGGPIGLLGGAG
jgi:hypothetical protein